MLCSPLGLLSNLYELTGRYDERERLDRRAVGIREQTFGVDHPKMVPVLRRLAETLELRGKWTEAVATSRRALAIAELAQGGDHPDVAQIRRELEVALARAAVPETPASTARESP